MVNWRVAGRMLAAWAITLPSAAVVGAITWFIGHSIGGVLGALVVFTILLVASGWMYLHSKKSEVDHNNVNDDWDGAPSATTPAPATSGGAR